jgi:galactosamine-6-phosphate isomerase
MNLLKFKTINELTEYGSESILQAVREKPDLLLCTASGNSTTEIYTTIGRKKGTVDRQKLRIIKLDEWGGIELENPETCETYLRKYVIKPLEIRDENYISFDSNPVDSLEEVNRIQAYLDQNGPIDYCVLGLGLNGHIAFNEPSSFLQADCHITALSEASKNHPMFVNMDGKPSYGLTLGMANILQSRKILLVILGKNKQPVIDKFLTKEITTSLPASFLWLHSNVDCLMLENC